MSRTLRLVAVTVVVATAVTLVENVLASRTTGAARSVTLRSAGWKWIAGGNSISITRSGITLTGSGGSIQITPAGISIDGTLVQLNCGGGACQPVARQGDPVTIQNSTGIIVQGAPTVLAG